MALLLFESRCHPFLSTFYHLRRRCRDEGPRRLKVRWFRADGQPLKSGHSDHRGRLTLPRVTPDDAGVYLCVPLAADGQELRPSQKSATLVVTSRVYPPTLAPVYPFSRTTYHDPNFRYGAAGFGQSRARRQRRQQQRPMAAASAASGSDTKKTVALSLSDAATNDDDETSRDSVEKAAPVA